MASKQKEKNWARVNLLSRKKEKALEKRGKGFF